jgi:nitrous oxidase accessory protein NosD
MVASAGDTISLDTGTYVEQVTIAKSLTLTGARVDVSVIKAPSVLLPNAETFFNIVEINGSVSVKMRELTVAGPGPGICGSIHNGIAVIGGATLKINHAAVRDIRDDPLGGCQNGIGIRAGTQPFGGPAQVGHLIADHVVVTDYQKFGIVVGGPGSTGQIFQNTVAIQTTRTATQAGPVGIRIGGGAVATVEDNTVTGNECNAPTCGPDWFTQEQSAGIFLPSPGAGTTVSNNRVNANDIGIYANGGGEIDHNDVSANRDFGLVIDAAYASNVHHNKADGANSSCPLATTSCDGILVFSSGATFEHNSADNNGNNGIEVGPLTPSAVGNTFQFNNMSGNSAFDANDHTVGSGTAGTGNTWTQNNCSTSSPTGLCK